MTMKNVKRILALIGVILLIALYVSTLVLAFIGNDTALTWLKISIFATVVVPVMLWAYSFIYRLLKNNYGKDKKADKETEEK